MKTPEGISSSASGSSSIKVLRLLGTLLPVVNLIFGELEGLVRLVRLVDEVAGVVNNEALDSDVWIELDDI